MMRLSVLLAAVAMTSAGFAQEIQTAAPTAKPGEAQASVPAAAAEEDASPLNLDVSVKWTTAYFFRGYNLGDEGLILQPEATIGYDIAATEELTVTPWFNAWSNVTDQHYDGNFDHWDELDLTGGVDFAYDRFTLSLQYIYYNSPAENFEDIHELGAVLSYDDSEQLGLPVALNPFVGFYQEINNEEIDEGTYMEVGLEPEWETEGCPVTLSFPITVGLGLNEWYSSNEGDERLVGFVSAGVVATYNITDNLYMTAGVEYLRLIADSVVDANDDTENQFVGSVGIGYTF